MNNSSAKFLVSSNVTITSNNENKDQNENVIEQSIENKYKKFIRENIWLCFAILGCIIGLILGLFLRNFDMNPIQRKYFLFPGEVFLRMFKFVLLPLITSSLITGIGKLNLNTNKKVVLLALGYFCLTTILACLLGLIIACLIKPGSRINFNNYDQVPRFNLVVSIFDVIRNLFPDNVMQIAFVQYESKLKINKLNVNEFVPGERSNTINAAGLIVFCIIFGYVLSKMDEKGKIIIDFFQAIFDAFIGILQFVVYVAPFGLCSLVCYSVLDAESSSAELLRYLLFLITVFLSLSIHGFLFLPLIYYIFTKKSCLILAKNMSASLITGLKTASSKVSLPVTMECIETKTNIKHEISSFTILLGSTINNNATCIYISILTVFASQMANQNLNFVDYLFACFTSIIASIGGAGVNNAGLITYVMVLSGLNLSHALIFLIFAFDGFIDRFRTLLNIWSNSIGCALVSEIIAKDEAFINKSTASGNNREQIRINQAYIEEMQQ